MPPVNRGPPPDGSSFRRTFPSKAKRGSRGGAANKKGMPSHPMKNGKKKGMKEGDQNGQKKDEFMMKSLREKGWKENGTMRMIVYHKCYLLLHGIAKVQKSKVMWENEHKGSNFFSQVNLRKLKLGIKATHADTETNSQLAAAYSFWKYLICTCGLLPNPSLLIHLLVLSSESELGRLSVLLTPLIDSFTKTFGSIIGNQGLVGLGSKCRSSFDETQAVTMANLKSLLNEYGKRQPEIRNTKDLVASLAEVYCEIERNRKENGNSMNKGTKKVFESSDEEEEISSKVSIPGAIVNGGEEDDEVDVKPAKNIKREMEEDEENEVKEKRKSKKVKEEEESEEEDEEEKRRKKKEKRKKQESECGSRNGWDDESNMEGGEEDEEEETQPAKYSDSTSNEFRSNLRELSKESWKKKVELFGIKDEPSIRKRLKMAQFIITYLEEKYGDELLEILQHFTCQSFSLRCFTKKEEVIGLVLYLDGRRLIGENFFFLIMASNDEDIARKALNGTEKCFKAQLAAARIERSISLGKPLHRELQEARKEAAGVRKNLERKKFHVFFPHIVKEGTMQKITDVKSAESREKTVAMSNTSKYTHEFWMKCSKLFNVESDWSVYQVNESAVRVFSAMDNMFQENLIPLIKVMSGGRFRVAESAFSDPSSPQCLTALHRMKAVGFFDVSLLFALLRFKDEGPMKKSLHKLSRLCAGFTRVVQTGARSQSLKTNTNFQTVKDIFSTKAMKVNADCLQFYEVLLNSKGRKRCLSTSSTIGRSGEEEEEKESRNTKRKKREKEREEEENEEGSQPMEVDMRRVKVEEDEEKKGKKKVKIEEEEEEKKRKKKKKEEVEESDDCMIIEQEKKKVKVEVISDDEEKEEKKRKKKEEKKSEEGENNAQNGEKSKTATEKVPIRVKIEMNEEKSNKETEEDGESHSNWIKMEEEEEMDEDEKKSSMDGEERDEQEGLTKVQRKLVKMSEYWDFCMQKWCIESCPSMDDRYKIAKMVILYLEDSIGEDFHNILCRKTGVKFTPSDLQEKEDVFRLVLYLDYIRFAANGKQINFFFLILALNDEKKTKVILSECVESVRLYMEYINSDSRISNVECSKSERILRKMNWNNARVALVSKIPQLFAGLKTTNGEEERFGFVPKDNKVEKMKESPYNDGNWMKYAKKFDIKSEWNEYEVCERASIALKQLNRIFNGQLFSHINKFFRRQTTDENTVNNIRTRTGLNSMMCLNSLKIFPQGLVFLFIRTTNDKMIESACEMLSGLVSSYSKYFDDFGPDFNFNAPSTIKIRSDSLVKHAASQNCLKYLLGNFQKGGSVTGAVTSSPIVVPSMIVCLPIPSVESSWKYNSKWKVSTLWSQSTDEWEREHRSDVDRLNDRIDRFMKATVTREEHYNRKMDVFDYIRNVLAGHLSSTGSTLTITGSSLCSLAAFNSNLDLFLECSTARVDQNVLMEILSREEGIALSTFSGRGAFHMIITNESTGNTPMDVSIHVNPSTLYMSTVYRMADTQDERVTALALIIKAWRIIDASCASVKIKSYHVMILLIHFLQCGVSPPILPSLILIYPSFDTSNYRNNANGEMQLPPSENTQSMASLLIGFFSYYSHFQFEKYIISIREGRLIKRDEAREGPSNRILIEHPYYPIHTKPHAVFTEIDFSPIRAACKRSLTSLTTTFNLPGLSNL